MWAARPHLANIFEKLLDQKTFSCLRLVLGIPPESGSARLGHIPSLPWESQLPLKPYLSLQPSDFEGNCDSLRFSLRFLFSFIVQFLFASQMWAARPHLANIFEKLLDQKTFRLPAARILQPIIYLSDESKWLPAIQTPMQPTIRQQQLAVRP